MKKCILTFWSLMVFGIAGALAQKAPVSAIGTVVSKGSAAVVPVTVENFSNIGACNIKIVFDPSIAAVDNVTIGKHVTPQGSLAFNTSVAGQVYAQWYGNPSATLQSGDTLLNLHFTRVATGTTTLAFLDDNNSSACAYAAFPSFEKLKDIPQGDYYKDGLLTFEAESRAPVTTISSVTACPGQTVAVPVTVTGFTGVGSASFTIHYDAAKLNNPVFTNTSGLLNLASSFAANGVITISGSTTTAGGVTLPDGSALFTLTFVNTGGTADISFYHETAVSCQYGGPPPGYAPLPDAPKSAYFIDGQVVSRALPTITATSNSPLCASGNLLLTGGPAGMAAYAWTGPNGFAASTQSPAKNSVTLADAGSYTLTVTDGNGCTNAATTPVTVNSCGVQVNGTYRHYGKSLSPLSKVTVDLKKGSQTLYSTSTGTDGTYSFPRVLPGTYEVVSTYDQPVKDAINALDAGLLSQWSMACQQNCPFTFQKVKFLAGDVIVDHHLDAADAGRINLWYLTEGTPPWNSPLSTWSFWKAEEINSVTTSAEGLYPEITVGDQALTQDFYGMVTGDFNQSWPPEPLKNGAVGLRDGKNIKMAPVGELILPVTADTAMTIGAFSLVLDFPYDKLEILEVTLNTVPPEPVPYNILNNQLRIGWFSNTPLTVDTGQILFKIKFRLKPGNWKDNLIRVTLPANPLNEVGDGMMQVIRNANLKAAILELSSPTIIYVNLENNWKFEPFPNPAKETLNLSYTLPFEGEVSLEAYHLTGRKLDLLPGKTQPSGSYNLPVNVSSWSSGVYLLKLNLKKESSNIQLFRKIVIF